MEKKREIWDVLSKIDCNKHTEKKNGLTYLSWVWAWGITKEKFPSLNYEVVYYDGKPYLFDEKLGYLITTKVTIDGETISMQLPVMDGANKAQKDVQYTYKTKFGEKQVEPSTMFDINTAIMRCLTKNLAMFGLGHYIYAGEDLPLVSDEEKWRDIIVTYQKYVNDINDQKVLLDYFNSLPNEHKSNESIKSIFSSKKAQLTKELDGN